MGDRGGDVVAVDGDGDDGCSPEGETTNTAELYVSPATGSKDNERAPAKLDFSDAVEITEDAKKWAGITLGRYASNDDPEAGSGRSI